MGRLKARASDTTGDEGLSLVEVIVAITILAGVMAAASLFFVNALKSSAGHGQRQQAVALAQQALETAQAVKPADLLDGRTQSAVQALIASDTGSALTGQDVTSCPSPAGTCPLNYDASGATTPAIPLTQTQTVSGQVYTIRTFINGCWLVTSTGACTPTSSSGAQQLYRITVDVAYTTKGAASSCSSGCSYPLSALVDPHGDPKFNSNISTPAITSFSPASFAVGVVRTLTIQGSGFVAGATLGITSGGGTFGAITSNTGTAITVPFTAGTTAGNYTITVINPDGGRTPSTPTNFTLNPLPTVTSYAPATVVGGTPTVVTLTGTGFQANAVISGPSGTTVGATTVVNATTARASVTGPVAGGPVTLTLTNPDFGAASTNVTIKSAPSIATVSPSSVGVNTSVALTLNVNGLQSGAGLVVTNGTISGLVVNAGAGSVTATVRGTATGLQTLTLTNPDGGVATAGITFNALPAITSLGQSSISAGAGVTNVVINGSSFQSGMTAVVTVQSSGATVWNGATTISSGSYRFRYGSGALAKGSYTLLVTVTNPDQGVSNTYSAAWTVT